MTAVSILRLVDPSNEFPSDLYPTVSLITVSMYTRDIILSCYIIYPITNEKDVIMTTVSILKGPLW